MQLVFVLNQFYSDIPQLNPLVCRSHLIGQFCKHSQTSETYTMTAMYKVGP